LAWENIMHENPFIPRPWLGICRFHVTSVGSEIMTKHGVFKKCGKWNLMHGQFCVFCFFQENTVFLLAKSLLDQSGLTNRYWAPKHVLGAP